MKLLVRVVVVMVPIFMITYFWQAQKTVKVNEMRLNDKFTSGTISRVEYEYLKKQNTLLKVLV